MGFVLRTPSPVIYEGYPLKGRYRHLGIVYKNAVKSKNGGYNMKSGLATICGTKPVRILNKMGKGKDRMGANFCMPTCKNLLKE
jgi:hypothetical protein